MKRCGTVPRPEVGIWVGASFQHNLHQSRGSLVDGNHERFASLFSDGVQIGEIPHHFVEESGQFFRSAEVRGRVRHFIHVYYPFSPTLKVSHAEQVFDRRSAVKLYRIFAAEHGVVNRDTPYSATGCDGSPASEAMLHRTGVPAMPQSFRQKPPPLFLLRQPERTSPPYALRRPVPIRCTG